MNRIIITLSALALLGSCSMFKKTTDTSNSSSNTVYETSDRTQVTSDKKHNKNKNFDYNLDGEWLVATIGSTVANGEETPSLTFSDEGLLYANLGCNILNASLNIKKGGKIEFVDMLSTMRECHDMKSEDRIKEALANTKSYVIDAGTLSFMNETGAVVMTLKKFNKAALNGAWRVISIKDTKITNKKVQLVIDTDDNRLHGFAGCNVINGNIELDGNNKNTNGIQFSEITSTRATCPDIAIETALLLALEEVQKFVIADGGKTIELTDGTSTIITLKK